MSVPGSRPLATVRRRVAEDRVGGAVVVVDPVAPGETVVGNPARPGGATDQTARIDRVVCAGGHRRCGETTERTDGSTDDDETAEET